MSFPQKFDQLFAATCKEVGGIEGFLKAFFGFMYRRTDFFYQSDPGDKMGFPPGVNLNMVLGHYQLLNIFKHYQQQHYKKFKKKSIQQYQGKLKKYKGKIQKQKEKIKSDQKKQIKVEKVEQQKQEQKSKQKQIIINTYNGAINQKYSWSQQTSEVQITIEIQKNITAKDVIYNHQLNVELSNQRIKIYDKINKKILIQGQFFQKISASNSYWKVQNNVNKKLLVLTLEKASQRIWGTVLKGDQEIDTSKVDNTKKMSQFDQETQGALRKIMYEQQRKMQGLPTTDEQKQMELLKKAWDAQGSPFKGTPFDPSKLNLSGFNPDMMK